MLTAKGPETAGTESVEQEYSVDHWNVLARRTALL